ncbi:MAG: hypothetical protein KG028_01715 [Actinobacteria bacterium]|jgi:hypothetical protein|nr:hypothetical protein [Actinomycetota bacterium]
MKKLLAGGTIGALLLAPSVPLLALAVLLNPGADASCLHLAAAPAGHQPDVDTDAAETDAPQTDAPIAGGCTPSYALPGEPSPLPGGAGGLVPDPTGTGGYITPRTAHLVTQLETAFGPLPIWCWAPRPGNPNSDHPRGRACDITIGGIGRFPTATERAEGWRIADWLTTHANALALSYIVWDGLIWSAARATEGWRTYTSSVYDVRHPTGGHYDHLHISVR